MFRLTYLSLRIGSLEEFMKTIYNIFLSLWNNLYENSLTLLNLSKIWTIPLKQDVDVSKFPWKNAAIPINKQLYSISYVCFTSGVAGIVFSVFYILVI
jgi:hypothetical protein